VSRVPDLQLPAGRYLSAPIDVSPDAGGQTRAMLMRNRLFVSEAGIEPMVLTFSARNDLAERREKLLERGLIVEQISTPNIFEHYREHGWGPTTADQVFEPMPTNGLQPHEETYPDGRPWRVDYRNRDGRRVFVDYLRDDGTPFIRVPRFVFHDPSSWPKKIQQLGPDGGVVGEFGALGGWFRRWIRDLTEEERSFVFIDSRFNAQHIVPMKAPHIHLLYVLHNVHVLGPHRLWSSNTTDMYRRLLNRVNGMDALVTLTDRQRDDIALRRGRTNNMFVIPNPVDLPDPPELPERDPDLVAVVARLEHQKRLLDAIRAFAMVREQVPTARFDIYGAGTRRDELQDEIDRLGLGEAVTLRGHDPRARDALWKASAFLMTSSFEGYPLSTLESLSHGCPVVSYDIKYGPREQITDGVDGFLVERGDKEAMAERVVRLLRSPELVSKMSAAALEKAREHSKAKFVVTWRDVVEKVVEKAPRQVNLQQVDLTVSDLRLATNRPRLPRLGRARSLTGRRIGLRDQLVLRADATVEGGSPESSLDSAVWTLAAVDHDNGTWTDLPLTVDRHGNRFRLRTQVSLAEVLADAEPGADVRLRLRLVWENASWQTFVPRPGGDSGHEGVEVMFREDTLWIRSPGDSTAS
jgi:poly(glycerol-phosphate) alpha-glucosyltransferase